MVVYVKASLNHVLANKSHQPNVEPMLENRLRRLPNIGPVLGRCLLYGESNSTLQIKTNNVHVV